MDRRLEAKLNALIVEWDSFSRHTHFNRFGGTMGTETIRDVFANANDNGKVFTALSKWLRWLKALMKHYRREVKKGLRVDT